MNKQTLLLTIGCITFLNISNAQMSAPRGSAKGVFASYYLSALPNVDDQNADKRLDYVTTFKFGAGIEQLKWHTNNFGTGLQASYWQNGQNYSGILDTNTKTTYTAYTQLNYIKAAYGVHFRSYDRYNPEARFRFQCYVAPYIALNVGFSDKLFGKNTTGDTIVKYTFEPTKFVNNLNGSGNFDIKSPIYKFIDYGLIVAPGIQYMITPKWAITFGLRGDIGGSNVEFTDKNAIKNGSPSGIDYDPWGALYAKYLPFNQYNPAAKKDAYDKRAGTKNFSLGAQLSVRIYSEPQYDKD